MKPKDKVSLIDKLFTAFRDSSHNSRTFTSLHENFQSEITEIASSYPKFWQDDFIQEGNLGLHNAALKFDGCPTQFYFYALKAIRGKMIDFYRSAILRSTIEFTAIDLDDRTTIFRESIFVETEKYSADDGESYSILGEFGSPVDYVTSITTGIDIKYCLSGNNMRKNNFSEREIKVFDLHYKKGFNVSEVAKLIHLSVPQTSKIIQKTSLKVQQLLAA